MSAYLPWIILLLLLVLIVLNRSRLGILAELVRFLWVRKRWWLAPILLALILLGVFIFLTEALGPFMYAIF